MSEEAIVSVGNEGRMAAAPLASPLQQRLKQNLRVVDRPTPERHEAEHRGVPERNRGRATVDRRTLTRIPSTLFQTEEWYLVRGAVEGFKASFFELSHKLQQDSSPEIPWFVQDKGSQALDELNDKLQTIAGMLVKTDVAGYLWGYVFKEVFPYFMRSRFAERAYCKPGGYAGDYLMMEMIYNNKPDGEGKIGKLIDGWCLNTGAARAVRGRRKFLKDLLAEICGKRRNYGFPIRIMNLACGTNREMFDFLAECSYSDMIAVTGMDGDPGALEYTNRHVNTSAHSASVRLLRDNVVRWSAGRSGHTVGTQDIIYTAGLTDYLGDKVFTALVRRSFEHLSDGGTLIVGNFGHNNCNRAFMDEILQWRLIHRSEADLRRLFGETGFGVNVKIAAEENGVNLFAIATKLE